MTTFKVVEGDDVPHACCNDAAVITDKDEFVCECHNVETAKLIADLLNKHEAH